MNDEIEKSSYYWVNEINKRGGTIYHVGGKTDVEPGEMYIKCTVYLATNVEVYKKRGRQWVLHRMIPWPSISYVYVRDSPRNGVIEDFAEDADDQ